MLGKGQIWVEADTIQNPNQKMQLSQYHQILKLYNTQLFVSQDTQKCQKYPDPLQLKKIQ
jgi:stress response protein YsnF